MTTPTTSAPTVYSTLTGNSSVDLLIYGTQWANPNISYSFIVPGISYFSTLYPDTSLFQSIQALSSTQQNAFNNALSAWSNVAAVNFVQSADNSTTVGDIRVAFSWSNTGTNPSEAGFTYVLANPSTPASGDIWLNPKATDTIGGYANGTFANSNFQQGSYAYYTVLHELGHAIGLKHPFEISPYNSDAISPAGTGLDGRSYTLMSYTTLAGHPDAIGFSFNPTTPMVLDIAAIQSMYGANYAFNAGDTTYNFNDNPGQYYFQTIWDGGGSNTISYSGNTNSSIDLRQGYGSTIGNPVYAYTATNPNAYIVNNIWIAYGTHIDTASTTGTGNNTLTANNDGDTLIGGAGNDTLIGGTGNDTFSGGGGNDTFTGNGGVDTAEYPNALSTYTITPTSSGSTASSTSVTDATGTTVLYQIDYLKFSDKTIYVGSALTDANGNLTKAANIDGLEIAFTGDAAGNSAYSQNLNYTNGVTLANQFITNAGLTNDAALLTTVFNNLGLATNGDKGLPADAANNQAGLYAVMYSLIQSNSMVIADGGLAYATNWLVNALASITNANPNYAAYSAAAAALDTNIINAHNYSSQVANINPETIGTVSVGITGVLTQPFDQHA